jgi:hypothetical protein
MEAPYGASLKYLQIEIGALATPSRWADATGNSQTTAAKTAIQPFHRGTGNE